MIIFLILGIALGVVSVFFVLQNITPVTVSFLAWHLDGSLAVMLFLAMLSGMVMTLLVLLPSFIMDAVQLSRLKKKGRQLEEEHAKMKAETEAPVEPQRTAPPLDLSA